MDHAEGEFSSPLKFISDNWGLPYLTERIERTHNFEHAFAFGKNPARTRSRSSRSTAATATVRVSGRRLPRLAGGHQPDRGHFV